MLTEWKEDSFSRCNHAYTNSCKHNTNPNIFMPYEKELHAEL